MQDWRKIVGGNVRQARQRGGLTQEQVAHDSEIDVTYLRGIEAGRRNPSLLVMVRMAEALNLALVDLIAPPNQ